MNILVIDKQPYIWETGQSKLQGIQFTIVPSLEEAAELPDKSIFETLIISGYLASEWDMPQWMKAHYPAARWIMASMDMYPRYEELGAVDFMDKSLYPSEVYRVAERLKNGAYR